MKFRFLAALSLAVFFTACSHKIINPKIEKLQGKEKVLALNTELNKIQIELEKQEVTRGNLTKEVEDINQKVKESTEEANKLSEDLAKDPGNEKLAKKAKRAAKRASRDAKKASKLNEKLADTESQIKDYKQQIAQIKSELAELDSNIKFVPNSNQ